MCTGFAPDDKGRKPCDILLKRLNPVTYPIVSRDELSGLPEYDPPDISTQVMVAPTASGGQIGIMKIEPSDIDPNKKPVIFFGGLYHDHALYYSFAVELARAEGRVVYVVDAPGIGLSKLPDGETTRAEHFVESLEGAIGVVGLKWEQVDIIGHSLGTVTLRVSKEYEELLKQRGIDIVKRVLIAPIFAERETKMIGGDVSGEWAFKTLGSMFGNGGTEVTPVANDLFFQNHPEEEVKWLTKQVEKESLPASILSFYSIFGLVDENQIMSELANGDDRWVLVFAGEDRLVKIPPADMERLQGKKGIYIIDGADHSFLCWPYSEENYNNERKKFVTGVRNALNGVNSGTETINQIGLYQERKLHVKADVGIVWQVQSDSVQNMVKTGSDINYRLFSGIGISTRPWFAAGVENYKWPIAMAGLDVAYTFEAPDWRTSLDFISIGIASAMSESQRIEDPYFVLGVAGLNHNLLGFNIAFTPGFKFHTSDETDPSGLMGFMATFAVGWKK